MTDYPTSKKSSKKVTWKKNEQTRKWRAVLAIFICLFLGFFIISGVARAISFKKYISSSSWGQNEPYIAAVVGDDAEVFVFNKDLTEAVLIKVPNETVLVTGTTTARVQDIIESRDGARAAKFLTRALGVGINNFVVLKNGGSPQSFVAGLKSIKTPISPGGGIASTNITRVDLLRLWWQVKGTGINSPKIIDAGQFLEDSTVGGKKVQVLDRELLHAQINKYFEIDNIASQNVNLTIKNSSGTAGAGQLAGEMATAYGFNVISVESGEAKIQKCKITAERKNPGAVYLANIFKCDIVSPPSEANDSRIMLELGSDFAAERL